MSWQQAYENGKNGQSFWGQGYTSMWDGMAHADGQAARAAESASRASGSSSPIFSAPIYKSPTVSSGGGGGALGLGRVGLGQRQKGSSGILGAVFSVGLVVGIYDNVANKVPPADAALKAYDFVYRCSDAIGLAVEDMGTSPVFAWGGWAIRWGIAIPVGVSAGAGAFVGDLAIDLGKAFVQGWRTQQ